MLSCKFNIIFLTLILSVPSSFAIDDNQCLKETFEVEVSHKGQPFGALPVVLKIKKAGCILTVNHEKFKYVKKQWQIDVCREPVHIKKGVGAVEVIKKTSPCNDKGSGPFCKEYMTIKKIIQDDGLIFAEGEKETLSTDHGKTYCSYLLLKNYLNKSLVFNRGDDYSGVLSGKKKLNSNSNSSMREGHSSATSAAPKPIVEGVAVPTMEEGTQDNSSADQTSPVEEEKKPSNEGFF